MQEYKEMRRQTKRVVAVAKKKAKRIAKEVGHQGRRERRTVWLSRETDQVRVMKDG